MEKTERQLNLVALLLNARMPKPLGDIRAALYDDQPSDDAFKRMFERDKDELRSFGVGVELAAIGAWDEGYVVRRDEALLPNIDLTPPEHAALMIAAEAWGDSSLGPASSRMAANKLAAGTAESTQAPWILPQLEVRSAHVAPLTDAIHRRKIARFPYRASGAAKPALRTIEPHGVSFRSGSWYVTGLDRDRNEPRSFKLDRIVGAVKVAAGKSSDFELPAGAAVAWPSQEADAEARIAVDESLAWWAERRPGARRIATLPDGRIELVLPVADEDRFVQWVAGLAEVAEIVDPPHLRDAVVAHLRGFVEES